MGRPREKKADHSSSSTPPADAELGHNKLSDLDLQSLTIQHRDAYKARLAIKKQADADFKNCAKLAKAELGSGAIETIKAMIELETPEGEAVVKNRIELLLKAARWMGTKIGTQPDLFVLDGMPQAAAEGERAGLVGEPCRPPYDPPSANYTDWIEGWHRGQAVKARGFAGPNGADKPWPDDQQIGERAPEPPTEATFSVDEN